MIQGLIDKKYTKCPFTAEEDAKLAALVANFSQKDINWNEISNQMVNRNPRQCKDRWEGYLDSSINRSEFSCEENYFILKKVEEIGKKWKIISSLMKHRTDVAVKSQYRKLLRHNVSIENVFRINPESYMIKIKTPSKVERVIKPLLKEDDINKVPYDSKFLNECFDQFFAMENEILEPCVK
ncbi:Myb-like DNA-binding domain containing protein [Trichomonas vaginalis G3]|uniref:Myb-like DNA-binding domain containing protein n=1 Tax=Trichomonas vaginalis (strain ATCC PRA-98 / G3) TaxID=412133 RepID=A2FTZ9_TRIV3|nr:RNA polymerase II transcription regulator recruiting protein [Trichomonas vaginalis G3]EAX91616.1 Myb-like DNA-binding domain containing protein [Trichomonas vaginalis G3]KAI5509716.1 RNA polymerase II transcription regulator recruiting protein [Trichomonas vaginalis G3]|eukprot:XP_001304546.1 Myb-like DNA-binding domain containing protein [Trichomonas vaginalis G3]